MNDKLLQEIAAVLDGADDMTIATIRPDGYPQATTVSFVNDGMAIWFGAGTDSQKSHNIAGCDKVSLTVNLAYATWDEIRGVSIGGRASRVTDAQEMAKIGRLMVEKFPRVVDYAAMGMEGMSLFRVSPEVVSLLDYRKGFGHTDLLKIT